MARRDGLKELDFFLLRAALRDRPRGPRAFLGKLCNETLYLFSVKDRPADGGCRVTDTEQQVLKVLSQLQYVFFAILCYCAVCELNQLK